MPLYGHEIDATINPLEARLGWTISWRKEFIGREALLKVKLEKPRRLLVGLEMVDKAVAASTTTLRRTARSLATSAPA